MLREINSSATPLFSYPICPEIKFPKVFVLATITSVKSIIPYFAINYLLLILLIICSVEISFVLSAEAAIVVIITISDYRLLVLINE